MTKSKFRLWVLLPSLLLFGVPCLLYFIISNAAAEPPAKPFFPVYLVSGLFIFTWIWVVFGELRTKAIKVIIDGEDIKVRAFGGLSPERHYRFDDFDGFKTTVLSSRQGDYEYLYLIKKNKKVIKLSQFYHRNYQQLKQLISHKTNDLGYEKFSYRREFKEIFQ